MLRLPDIATAPFCPSEVHGSVKVPAKASFFRKWWLITGPALLVSVGYMDPGNWATDIAAGTQFGYDLLFVILLSNLAAIFLQSVAMRIGIVAGRDLAQLSRDQLPRKLNFISWFLAEIAIIACDVAEVLGAGLALHLLTGCDLTTGIALTALDTVIVLGLKGRGFRQVEAIILGLVATIGICFIIEMILAGPDWAQVISHTVPSLSAVGSAERIYLAIGIIGATVMPHNLYLHSSIVQTRSHAKPALREALRINTIDTVVALSLAFFVNAAILILAATAFHGTEAAAKVTGIADAYHFLVPALGTTLAMYVFGIALFASGQSATFTGTIAGQVILEGYLQLSIPCWVRRIITRALALIPALGGIIILGDKGIDKLLVLSQVVLGLQLPFAMMPLLYFASKRKILGEFRLRLPAQIVGWFLFAAIVGANLWLIWKLAN